MKKLICGFFLLMINFATYVAALVEVYFVFCVFFSIFLNSSQAFLDFSFFFVNALHAFLDSSDTFLIFLTSMKRRHSGTNWQDTSTETQHEWIK